MHPAGSEAPPEDVHSPAASYTMPVVHQIQELRSFLSPVRAAGKQIGLILTMGALHEGHLSLVRAAKLECDYVVATIFINPKQFDADDDLQRYPRNTTADCKSLEQLGVDLIFAPATQEIYPDGFSTTINPPAVAACLEGKHRPGHFRGVATVVLKFFQMAPADIAYFGSKDYQQSLVIQHMVRDLNLPIQIRCCPTVRDPDGLALSSRNQSLSTSQRTQARAISQSLACAQQLVSSGERDAATIKNAMQQVLSINGITKVDYISIADSKTLEEVLRVEDATIVLIAAYIGQIRLIDNQLLTLC